MKARKTVAQRVDAAKEKHLDASLDLLRLVEEWNDDLKGFDLHRQREHLFVAARLYSSTLDRLTRVRK